MACVGVELVVEELKLSVIRYQLKISDFGGSLPQLGTMTIWQLELAVARIS